MAVKERIKTLLTKLDTDIYEKEEVMALALLSSIAGESIFLLGPPGVAKSLIARRLKYAYKDAKVFEYLMSRFSTPDEIFGPVSIKGLKEDKYVRITDNYLPDAEVVFLDEIWKAGPSIQNALLTILNEKKFRNGEKEIDVPMKALISASNELPEKEQGLEALWDRFLVRLIVGGIENQDKFNEMITMPSVLFDEKKIDESITDSEYKEWSKEIDKIVIPENIFNVIKIIRNKVELHNQNEENNKKQIYVSDRRWRKIVRLMRTSAFLNQRKEVDLMDCFLIMHCIWDEEEQKDTVWQFVRESIEEHGYTKEIDFASIREELIEFKKEINTYTHEVKQIKHTINKEYDHNGEKYLRILDLQGKFDYYIDDLIKLSDINSAKNSYIETKRYRNDLGDKDTVYIKKGKNKHFLILSRDQYSSGYELPIEVIDVEKEKVYTKDPHDSIKKDWNGRVDGFLQHTSDMRNQIEQYRNKNLEHLRTNLFVDPSLANIVESHITTTQKEIDKIELEIREIQNGYKKLKNEEVVLDD